MVLFYLITVIPFALCLHVQIRLKTQIKTDCITLVSIFGGSAGLLSLIPDL